MKCGGCTLCCKLLELHEIPSKRGEWCRMCDPKKGCKIYHVRPEECRQFQCMWLQMKEAGEELRPDKCHVLFSKISDKVICGEQNSHYELTKRAKQQIRYFVKEGFSVAILNGELKQYVLAKGHTLKQLQGAINDRTELHRRLIRP